MNKTEKKKHGMVLMTHLSFCRDCRGGWALRAKTLPGMGLVIGTAIKEVARREAKLSIFSVLLDSSPCAPAHCSCPPSCLCCSRNCCWYGYTFNITMSVNITLKLVYIIQCVVKIRKEQLQTDLKSLCFKNTFIKVWFKLRNSKNKKYLTRIMQQCHSLRPHWQYRD